jgi:hypothetical protein
MRRCPIRSGKSRRRPQVGRTGKGEMDPYKRKGRSGLWDHPSPDRSVIDRLPYRMGIAGVRAGTDELLAAPAEAAPAGLPDMGAGEPVAQEEEEVGE